MNQPAPLQALLLPRPPWLEWLAASSGQDAAPHRAAAPDDEALMRLVAQGDGEAFAQLVARWERPARTWARRALCHDDEADDAVQDAFLELWRTAPRWRPAAPPRAWFHTLLGRRCMDRLRRRKFAPLGEPSPDHADTGPAADHAARASERQRLLASALAALPDRQRLALLLFHDQDLSLREGAAVLDLSPKAFESLLLRARKALREELARRGIHDAF